MPSTSRLLMLFATVATSACAAACTAKIQGDPRSLHGGGSGVTVYPPWANVTPGGNQPFSATVSGGGTVAWSLEAGAVGSVSSTGLYSAPADAAIGSSFHVYAKSSLDPQVVGSAVVRIASSASTPARYLGVNLGWVNLQGPFQLFGNVLKQGRPYTDDNDNVIPLDANGWPTRDGRIGFFEGLGFPSYLTGPGYKLRFRGQANLSGLNVTFSNKVYDQGSNITTADVQVGVVNNTWITFSQTKRQPTDTAGNGITELSLMRPGYSLNDYWYKDFVTAIQPFSVLRAMQSGGPGVDLFGQSGAVGVMGNRDTTWATRVKPSVGYAFNGPAWEEWVILANLTGKDIWICVPYHVDADYITKLAQLLRYGSDGINPYTSATHDPSTWTPTTQGWYPGLLPERTVYVEFVNELWNKGWGYPNSTENDNDYNAEIAAGDPHHLNFDGKGDSDRRVAWKTVWISQLFRSVWGDASMGTRVRMVLANQGDWGFWNKHQSMLTYMDGVWGTGASSAWSTIDGITNAKQPPAYYVHNISGSYYIHAQNTTTPDLAFSDLNTSLKTDGGIPGAEWYSVFQRIGFGQTMATRYPGLKFSTYEAGVEVVPNATLRTCDADPRMKTLHDDFLHQFYAQSKADVFVYFWLVGDSAIDAGLSGDLKNLDTPRWQSVKEIASGL